MKLIRSSTFLFLFIISGCNEYNKRTIRRTLKISKEKYIEWYYYSIIEGSSPDYIDIKYNNGNFKPICSSPFICDINLSKFKDTLFIAIAKNVNIHFYDTGIINLQIDSSKYCSRSSLEIRE